MKYLVNPSYKVLRKGDFVEATADGEFIYQSGNVDGHPKALLIEIAEKNGIKVKKSANLYDIVEALDSGLEDLNLKEQNKMTETQIVEKIVKAGFKAGKTDDEMLLEIVENGVSFMKAGRLFKKIVNELGLRISNKERYELISEYLEESVPETGDELLEKIQYFTEAVPDTNEKQALAAIKKFCRENDLEIPKMPKKTRSSGGSKAAILNWMIEHPGADEDELVEMLEEKGKNENAIKRFVELYRFAHQLADAKYAD